MTPSRRSCASHRSRSFCHSAKVRISAAAASPSASARYNQSSSTMRPSRSSRRGIHSFLERFHAETAHDIEETLIRLPPFHVYLEQTRNRLGHVNLRHRWADDL